MFSNVVWFGIDFSFTIMNPLTMHHHKVIPEICVKLGQADEGPRRLALWYKLRDSMGSPIDPAHQKVRLMKEYHRDRIHAEVFDNNPRMIELYAEAEATERKPSEGLREGLEWLREGGKTTSIVSEVSSVPGTLTIIAFLKSHQLVKLFDEVITPAGRFTTEGNLLDGTTFKGTNKKEGTLYERLSSYLDSKGVSAGRRAMVGDDPKQDVELAKKYGFVTVQYCGIIDRGRTDQADNVIMNWKELANLH